MGGKSNGHDGREPLQSGTAFVNAAFRDSRMTAPLHLFLFVQSTERGGVERVALRLARDWGALGHRVTLVAGIDPPGWLDAPMPGVEAILLGSESFFTIGRVIALARERRPDVIFCPGNHYTSRAGLMRIALGRDAPPLVWKVSNALERTDRGRLAAVFFRFWLRRHPAIFDAAVVMSDSVGEQAARVAGFLPAAVTTIPNPPLHGDAAAGDPKPPSGRFILGIGRLERQKDWPLALRSYAALGDPDRDLYILGEGSERGRLVALASRLGIAGRVHLAGFVGDVRPWLARADALLLTSLFEGTPNVVREAVGAGTPVVTTLSSPAIPELLGADGGLAVEERSPDTLAAAIRDVLAAPRPAATATRPDDADPLASARAYARLFARLAGKEA